MPTVREIEAFLYRLAPRETAMAWDNIGCLAGDPDGEVCRVLVSLDVTEMVVREAVESGCQLVVAHHPLMNCKWHPVQTVRTDTPQGRLLALLLRNGVSAICMHTNLDLAPGGVNDCLAVALGLADVEILPGSDGFCRRGTLPKPMPLEAFAAQAAEALGCSALRYADGGKQVWCVATGGGACGEYAEAAIQAGCDTFVTADLKYHGFLDAVAAGLNMVDAGHFATEDMVCGMLVAALSEAFPWLAVCKSALHQDVIRYYIRQENSKQGK